MRTVILVGLVACCATLAAVERGTPATIVYYDGRTLGPVYLVDWNFEKAHYLLEQGKAARGEESTDKILRIDLNHTDRAFAPAEYRMEGGNYVDAIAGFTTSSRTSLAAPTRVLAQLRIAQCYAALKKYDKAIEALDDFLKKYKKWVYVVDAMALRAEYLLASDDVAGAEQAYRDLDKQAPSFGGMLGLKAKAKAAVGLASILRKQGKNKEAAELTLAALKSVNPANSPEEWATMAKDLVDDYLKSDQADAAVPIYQQLKLAPVDGDFRAFAYLALARRNVTTDRELAFDQACAAALLTDDTKLYAEAKGLADAVVEAIRKDEAVSNAVKSEYIAYLKKL